MLGDQLGTTNFPAMPAGGQPATAQSLPATNTGADATLSQSLPDASAAAAAANRATRFAINVPVHLRPSSSSQRLTEDISGYCKNISRTGCGVVVDFAPRCGDIYRFEVTDDASHEMTGVHGRCVRCQFLDEEAFEAGFRFLAPLPSNIEANQSTVIEPLV
ncbi:MAG: PilZ domain-containing protein [Pirellulaceae bacterium]